MIAAVDATALSPVFISEVVSKKLQEMDLTDYDIGCFISVYVKILSMKGLFPEREASYLSAWFIRRHYLMHYEELMNDKQRRGIRELQTSEKDDSITFHD